MKIFNNSKLRKEFLRLNERFFDNKLNCEVRFGSISTDGLYQSFEDRIMVSSRLRYHPTLAVIVLLHEMAHANMDLQGYQGYPGDGGHGMLYQAELNRLYKEGAYDNLL